MKVMTSRIHRLGLKIGWYGNNCGCSEHQNVPSWGPPASASEGATDESLTDGIKHYAGDVKAVLDFGFDGIKLDGCGEFRNLSVWAQLLNQSGRPVLIEDCHWGGDGPGMWGDGGTLNSGANQVPEASWQPSNFFRVSGDIGASWGSWFQNLQAVVRWQPWRTWRQAEDDSYRSWFQANVRTGPGRWAYPGEHYMLNQPSLSPTPHGYSAHQLGSMEP